jgi:hypothetical protein
MELFGNDMSPESRPVLYDPENRNGFLKEVTAEERRDMQADSTEGWECPICQDGLDQDGEVAILPECKHIFHSECLKTWFGYHGFDASNSDVSHNTCPMCRKL